MQATFIDNAKVMAKGQVTIPKDVRKVLGVSDGDKVTFVVENGNVKMVNSAIFSMQILQQQMADVPYQSEEDINDLVKEIRGEGNN